MLDTDWASGLIANIVSSKPKTKLILISFSCLVQIDILPWYLCTFIARIAIIILVLNHNWKIIISIIVTLGLNCHVFWYSSLQGLVSSDFVDWPWWLKHQEEWYSYRNPKCLDIVFFASESRSMNSKNTSSLSM